MMRIHNLQTLIFYIKSDQIMNRGGQRSWRRVFYEILFPDAIMRYLRLMRLLSYLRCFDNGLTRFVRVVIQRKYTKLGQRLGFDIDPDVFGYGLSLPHWGTVVVGGGNDVGNYAVIHTSTCIAHHSAVVGDGLYLSTGSVIAGEVALGNYVTITPCSLVNKPIDGDAHLPYFARHQLSGGIGMVTYIQSE